ncbi:WD40-repeat-containing domain protein [Hyaloraphidium curvatum]|nr:WD40-repeat-containing domain protein [Hyaloraphidium curvatum]
MAAAVEAVPAWRAAIAAELDARDRRERDPFAAVVDANAALSTRLGTATARVRELEDALQALQREYGEAQKSLASVRETGSEESAKRLARLQEEVSQLKDERNDLYRLQATNAQRVVELTDAKRALEAQLAAKTAECDKLQASLSASAVKLQDKDHLLQEKDNAIQILRDEHQAIDLELRQKESRLAALEKENAELLERYLKEKTELADKVNEANQILEDAKRARDSALRPPTSPGRLSPSDAAEMVRRKGSFSVLPTQAARKLTAHRGDTNCLAVSGDGRLFATGSDDRTVVVWDAGTGGQKGMLQGSGAGVVSAAFSYGNEMLVAGANDNVAKVWTLATGRLKHTLTGHAGKVFSCKFTVDSKVITGSHDRTLKVWDLARGYCTKSVHTLSSCNDLCLLDDGGHLVASGHLDNNIRIWDMATGKLIRELTGLHSEQITSVEVSEDRTQILTTSRDNTLRLVDARTFLPLAQMSAPAFRVAANHAKSALSADARYACSGSADGGVYFWNCASGNPEPTLRGHSAPVCSVSWSPLGGARVFSMDTKKGIVIWGGQGDAYG